MHRAVKRRHAVGERQWEDGLLDRSAVIEIARREGGAILLPVAGGELF